MANCPANPCFNEDVFKCSNCFFFPNPDVKYEVNKLRSQAYAARHNVGIVYSVAKGTPSSDALRVQPDLPILKLS